MKPIKELVETYKNTDPEIIYEWDDEETGAKGWLVINSLRGGAAGGGTRMRKNATKDEVISLAKTMEVKFTIAGPAIGGAKSGIDFDPEDPRKGEVLNRWYKAISPRLKSHYGTGGDLNVSDQEVIDYTKPYVRDPQEGIVIGQKNENVEKIIEQLQTGVSLELHNAKYSPLTDVYKINDMITGFGVVESLRHYYRHIDSGESLQGKKAIVQGWGNVGAAAGYFLAQNGAKIVAISDKKGSLIKNEGFSVEEIIELFKNTFIEPKGIIKHKDKDEGNRDAIFDVKADIFAPCAGSFLISDEYIVKLYANGVEVIAPGANVPFEGQENANIYSDTTANADNKFAVIPDFIANSGMAHTFAYLMQNDISVTEDGIFTSVSEIISEALSKIKKEFGDLNLHLTEKAIRIALRELGYE